MGVCKTPLHNISQKRLIIKVWGCLKSFFGGRLQNARTQHIAKAIDYQGMGLSEKFFLGGRLQNARTQHTAKAIDYQGMGLSEKFFWGGVYNRSLQ